MSERLKPMLGAYLALYVVAYCGVRFIFAGMLPEPPFEPILSMPFALLVFAAVVIVFFLTLGYMTNVALNFFNNSVIPLISG